MRFRIQTTAYGTSETMLNRYPILRDFGFEIEKKVYPKITKIKDEKGEELTFKHDHKTVYTPYIYIYGLDELMKLIRGVGVELVINKDENGGLIEIYDTWRE